VLFNETSLKLESIKERTLLFTMTCASNTAIGVAATIASSLNPVLEVLFLVE
jgi:hypothetical protein